MRLPDIPSSTHWKPVCGARRWHLTQPLLTWHRAAGDGNVVLWNTVTGQRLFSFPAHKKGVNSLAFSPNGNLLATGGNDAVARVWDASSGENQSQMIGGTYAVPDIAFTPDGASLAVVNGEVVRLRDVASGRFADPARPGVSLYRRNLHRWQVIGHRRQPGDGHCVGDRFGSGHGNLPERYG